MHEYMFCFLCGDTQEAEVRTKVEREWATIRQVHVCLTCGHAELTLLPITIQEPACGNAYSAS